MKHGVLQSKGDFLLGYRSYMNILSVRIDKEAREGAVFVGVPTMNFASVELYTHFISYIQVQDDTVRGVVIVLICVLGDGTGPDLPVLLEVRPHARAVPSSHQDMVGKVVDAWQRAGELACTGLVVVPHVGHYIIKLKYFTAFVLLPQAGVEGDFWTVNGLSVPSRPRAWWTRWTGFTRFSRRPFGTRRPREPRAPSKAVFPSAGLKVRGLRGDGCELALWGGKSVTHHLAAPKHLVMCAPSSRTPSPLSGVDQ